MSPEKKRCTNSPQISLAKPSHFLFFFLFYFFVVVVVYFKKKKKTQLSRLQHCHFQFKKGKKDLQSRRGLICWTRSPTVSEIRCTAMERKRQQLRGHCAIMNDPFSCIDCHVRCVHRYILFFFFLSLTRLD